MNLAEIRKKAQQEKVRKEMPSTAAFSGEEPLKAEQEEQDSVTPSPGPPPEELVETVPLRPSVIPACVPRIFDPLAVLLEGRAIAGCEEESTADDTDEEETDDFQEFLCFRVSSEHYAVNIMDIKEIIKPREITEVPRAPSFVSGVLSLRGIIIPVLNLQKRLNLEGEAQGSKERIIVIKKGEEFCGVLVDEVTHVVKISVSSIEQPPAVLEGIDREFVDGIGRCDGRMLILLNLRNVLDLTLC